VALTILGVLLSVAPVSLQEANANELPGPPDADGHYAHCNVALSVFPDWTAGTPVLIAVTCQYGDPGSSPPAGGKINRIRIGVGRHVNPNTGFAVVCGSDPLPGGGTNFHQLVNSGGILACDVTYTPSFSDTMYLPACTNSLDLTINADGVAFDTQPMINRSCTVQGAFNDGGYLPYPKDWWPGGAEANGWVFGSCGLTHSSCPTGMMAEPVNTQNGSYFTSATDAFYPGIGVPFAFVRSYNSADSTLGPLGPGWTHSYNVYLYFKGGGDIVLHAEDGQQLTYFLQPDSTYKPQTVARDALTRLGDGTYKLVTRDQIVYLFDTGGKLSSERDLNGQGIALSYTGGMVSLVTDSVGRQISLGYTNGLLTSLSLPDGRSVSYGYTNSLLTSVLDLRGNSLGYGYDPNNLLNQVTDQNLHTVVHNVYGLDGRVTEQTDGRGHTTFFDWDPSTQTATITDPRGKQWKDVYDGGQLVRRIDPLLGTTVYTYDANSNVSTITDAGNNTGTNTITYHYDPVTNNLTQKDTPSPLGYNSETWAYNPLNEVTSHTDGRSPQRTTRFEYDQKGNPTCILYANAPPGITTCAAAPQSAKVTFGVDPVTGLRLSKTDQSGNTWDFSYDTSLELQSVTGPSVPFGSGGSSIRPVTSYSYWPSGMVKTRVEPRGNVPGGDPSLYTWSFGYTDANQPTSITDPLGNQASYTFDPTGNIVTRTAPPSQAVPAGAITRYEYDENNNLTCLLYPDVSPSVTTCSQTTQAHRTNYGYDFNDNMTSRADGNNHTWLFAFDDANRLQTKTSPGTKVWAYEYWPDGLLKKLTLPSGNRQYNYDQLNRLSGITYSNTNTPNVTFAYDANGSRSQATDGFGTVNYVYDDLNRLSQVSRGSDVFLYAYRDPGDLKQVTYPDGTNITYSYYADRSLCWVFVGVSSNACSTPPSGTSKFQYDPAANPVLRTLPNGNTSTLVYDRSGRLTSVVNKKGATTLSSSTLVLDGVGNPTQNVTNSGTINYTYDAFDRILSACYSTCTGTGRDGYGYTYDPSGNILARVRYASPNVTTTYKYDVDDRLCWAFQGSSSNACGSPPGGATVYTFAPNGEESAAGTTTFTHDLEGRLLTAAVPSQPVHTYSYDADGARMQDSFGSGAANNVKYVWNPNSGLSQLILERDGNGATLRRYVYGDVLLQLRSGGAEYAYMLDPLGSVTNVTSSNGSSVLSYTYEPFGAKRSSTGTNPTNFLRFGGQLIDSVDNLYDQRARMYDPAIGRFLELDPLPAPKERPYAAPYAYADDRPTVFVDPSGMGAEAPDARHCRDIAGATTTDYLLGWACPPLGFPYQPQLVKTPYGWRAMDPNGTCSAPIAPFFTPACKTHDYGYDLVRAGVAKKHEVDDLLLDDMSQICHDEAGFLGRIGCDSAANITWDVVYWLVHPGGEPS
jgi:RHS repeat-associated protein